MGKFKKELKPKEGSEELQIGSWLLPSEKTEKTDPAENSTEKGKREDQTVYIDMDRLQANGRNAYSVEDLEEMADAIVMAGGILQNLIVKPADEDGYYEITTGERRWRGAMLARKQGRYPEEYGNKVPCVIRDPKDVALPLSDESKEMFSILVTNRYREKTDGDIFMEIREWKKIFSELRKQGTEYLALKRFADTETDGADQEEKEPAEAGIQIKGVPTRELVGRQMGISTGQVSRFENVEKNASEAVLQSLMRDEISLGEAEDLVSLPESEQDELLEKKEQTGVLPKEQIRKKQEERKEKIPFSKEIFVSDTQSLIALIGDNGMELTEEQYKKYQKCMTQLKKIFE